MSNHRLSDHFFILLITTCLICTSCKKHSSNPVSNEGQGSSSGNIQTGPTVSVTTSTVTSSVTSTVTDTTPDAGCDEDAVGENYYIQNCTPGGNGTPILRQIPTVVQNNCQP